MPAAQEVHVLSMLSVNDPAGHSPGAPAHAMECSRLTHK